MISCSDAIFFAHFQQYEGTKNQRYMQAEWRFL